MKINILMIVVIYKTPPCESATISSLSDVVKDFSDIKVLVYDNSPVCGSNVDIDQFEYFAAEENRGLACAYNYGLKRAVDYGASLLVTLDQDSVVSREYVEALGKIVVKQDDCVAVFCPEIFSSGRRISPYYFDWKGSPCFDGGRHPLEAINSFSAYSVSHLVEMGGFDDFYWLDALDFSSFSRIHKYGWRIGKIPVTVLHDLSVISGVVPLWRINNIARYESCFLAEFVGLPRFVVGLGRVFLRSIRLLFAGGRLLGVFSIIGAILFGAGRGVIRRLRYKREGVV